MNNICTRFQTCRSCSKKKHQWFFIHSQSLESVIILKYSTIESLFEMLVTKNRSIIWPIGPASILPALFYLGELEKVVDTHSLHEQSVLGAWCWKINDFSSLLRVSAISEDLSEASTENIHSMHKQSVLEVRCWEKNSVYQLILHVSFKTFHCFRTRWAFLPFMPSTISLERIYRLSWLWLS